MTYAPKTLTDLGTLWSSKGGVMLGVVGNQKHCAGYHLGKDRIYSECACKPDGTCEPGLRGSDYSVTHSRDKAGLTNAASAIDLGKLGTYAGLYRFSRWLVAQCSAGAPGSRDVREIIYSPDGMKVQRWSGLDNAIHSGAGNGDPSHRTHTHISYFRDSEKRDKRPLFAPYFAPPDTSTEEPEDPMRKYPRIAVDAVPVQVTPKTDKTYGWLDMEKDTIGKILPDFGTRWALPCVLTDGTIDHKAGGLERKVGYLTTGDNGTFVLATDVTVKAMAGDKTHKVAVLIDGVAKWTEEV